MIIREIPPRPISEDYFGWHPSSLGRDSSIRAMSIPVAVTSRPFKPSHVQITECHVTQGANEGRDAVMIPLFILMHGVKSK